MHETEKSRAGKDAILLKHCDAKRPQYRGQSATAAGGRRPYLEHVSGLGATHRRWPAQSSASQ